MSGCVIAEKEQREALVSLLSVLVTAVDRTKGAGHLVSASCPMLLPGLSLLPAPFCFLVFPPFPLYVASWSFFTSCSCSTLLPAPLYFPPCTISGLAYLPLPTRLPLLASVLSSLPAPVQLTPVTGFRSHWFSGAGFTIMEAQHLPSYQPCGLWDSSVEPPLRPRPSARDPFLSVSDLAPLPSYLAVPSVCPEVQFPSNCSQSAALTSLFNVTLQPKPKAESQRSIEAQMETEARAGRSLWLWHQASRSRPSYVLGLRPLQAIAQLKVLKVFKGSTEGFAGTVKSWEWMPLNPLSDRRSHF